MSRCVGCGEEIVDRDYMINGAPSVCAWTPPGAGKSVYAIVLAHLRCMSVAQLQQALKAWEEETRRRGYPALIVGEVEKRLSYLLARGADVSIKDGAAETSRFSELDL